MVLDSNQLRDVNRLKEAAIEMVTNRWLPNGASKKLRELLADQTLDAKQFTQELQKIVKRSEGLNWDRFSSKIQTQVGHFSGLSLIGILLIFSLIFVFRKRLFSKEIRTKLSPFLQSFINRSIALLAYFLCIVTFYKNFGGLLKKNFPLVDGLFPEFVVQGAYFLTKYDFFITIGYIIFILKLLQAHFPKLRILRYHLLQGVALVVFERYPSHLIGLIFQPTFGLQRPTALLQNITTLEFVLNSYFILTALYQAVTLSYPKNEFFREAFEIFLGRDDEGPDGTPFKWWNK
jgi:hypothetical protein